MGLKNYKLFHLHIMKEYTHYPGTHNPPPEIEKLVKHLQLEGAVISTPLVNMDDFGAYYKIEMVIPGAKREDILVYIQDSILSVAAAHRQRSGAAEKTTIHEFDRKCFERHISLPEDGDAAFIQAEFRQGLLKLYIPKSDNLTGVTFRQVVVY